MKVVQFKVIRAVIIAVVCSWTGAVANAQQSAEFLKVKTPDYSAGAEAFEPALGRYTYDVTWQGIPAATLSVGVEREGEYFKIETEAKTAKLIDVFYKLRYKADATISAIDFSPVASVFDVRENSRRKVSQIVYLEDGSIHSVYKKNGEVEHDITFHPENLTLDPFAAAFLARSLDWNLGDTKVFDTYNGRHRYLIELSAVDRVAMRVNGGEVFVWVIAPGVRKLPETGQHQKLREAKIYVTDNAQREILRIKSEVFVGSVNTKLVAFVPSLKAAGTSVARRIQQELFFK